MPRGRLVAAAAAVAAAAVAVATSCGGPAKQHQDVDAQKVDRFATAAPYTEPDARLQAAAQQAEADGDAPSAAVLTRLATIPSGIWLTPETHPVGTVGAYVAGIVRDAGPDVPLFVVYGIPERDCTGGFSAGGLTPSTYLPWVRAIADSAHDSQAVVVLEPDAVASSPECGGRERLDLLRQAVALLAGAHVTTYLDAGHSDWIAPARMAPLLRQAGVGRARGFSTNVANYQPQSLEVAYATNLSQRLDDAHFVIDTGRNGTPIGSDASAEAVTDWCNPPGRALGTEPGYVDDGSALDAVLWIKPPEESDGTCHGGPPAGEPWISRAVRLGENAGW